MNAPNAPAPLTPIEVIDPKESKAILERSEERITEYLSCIQRGEKINQGFRFLIGAQIIVARPHLAKAGRGDTGDSSEGDGVEAWLKEKFPLIAKRTAYRYVELAQTIFAMAEKCKSDRRSLLQKLPQQLLNGGLPDKERESVLELVPEITGGESDVDFIDKHAPKKPKGGLRKIGFSCPHCSTRNTGLQGRQIKCVNEKCGKRITVKPDVDPDAEHKRRVESLTDNLQEFVAAVVTLRESNKEDAPLLFTPELKTARAAALREFKWLGRFLAKPTKAPAQNAP